MAIQLPPELAKRLGVSQAPDSVSRYRVLRGFCLGNGVDALPGDEVCLPSRTARGWVASGRLSPAAPAVRAEPAAIELENADPVLEHADPPPMKTRRKARGAAEE